ncbi:arginase family protein [Saccharopolyspora elongata]|uniref:Arginase family protein n=1 Tax=Saccharopolyspora elongata TaxID=2530387 RepID=A0A4R4Z0Z8_9PSEU|nr:arginase family protein [Saccharopolyspora elongata]TDD51416.1 arginase family protein [Saccharopolyspora elongata]
MAIVSVPYHLDERLPEPGLPLPSSAATVEIPLPDGDVWQRLGALYSVAVDEVARVADRGEVPTVVSGDCMVSLAVLAGLQRAGTDAAIVWFDAHGDVQTVETTESGYVGGMPLRIAVGYRPELIADRLGLRPLPEDRALLVDARDLDEAEVEYLATSDIVRCGVDEITEDVLPDGPLLLHIDLDVIDTAELPGMSFPVGGGPSRSAVLTAIRRILSTGRVRAFDVACTWRPDEQHGEARARVLADLLAASEAPH